MGYLKRTYAFLQVPLQVSVYIFLVLQLMPRVFQRALVRFTGQLDGHLGAVPHCCVHHAGSPRVQALACSHHMPRLRSHCPNYTTTGLLRLAWQRCGGVVLSPNYRSLKLGRVVEESRKFTQLICCELWLVGTVSIGIGAEQQDTG